MEPAQEIATNERISFKHSKISEILNQIGIGDKF